MIPGLGNLVGLTGNHVLSLTASEQNVIAYTRVGSPPNPVTVDITIFPSVVISSSSPSLPALDLSGFAYGSTVNLLIRPTGILIGAGGAGGDGEPGNQGVPTGWPFRGGGGGGGFGSIGGPGGTGVTSTGPGAPGTDGGAGSDADPDIGGIAGANGSFEAPFEIWTGHTTGGDGGDCIEAIGYGAPASAGNLTLNIENEGAMYPGGGGGAGGYWQQDQGESSPYGGGASGAAGGENTAFINASPGPYHARAGQGGRYLYYSQSPSVAFTYTGSGDLYGSAEGGPV